MKLMDFSISQLVGDNPLKERGTIAYMTPEHFDESKKLTIATDIFSLGTTMYEMLVGRPAS